VEPDPVQSKTEHHPARALTGLQTDNQPASVASDPAANVDYAQGVGHHSEVRFRWSHWQEYPVREPQPEPHLGPQIGAQKPGVDHDHVEGRSQQVPEEVVEMLRPDR
jgi:hypothetical protein